MTATRDSIAAAASRLFADQGYTATSVRTIAAAAGVDPALVIRHFGSKESLFLETTTLGGTVSDVVRGPLSGIGEAIARYVVVEAGSTVRQAFVALQQASGHPQVRAQLAAAIDEVFVTPLAPRLAGPDAEVRSRLVASLVGGLMTALWSTGDEGLLAADPETVIGYYGDLVQRLVDAPRLETRAVNTVDTPVASGHSAGMPPRSRYADLSREELAVLVPELLLIGQLIDRSGMAWCISAFGREEMAQIAIEEWAGSSPIYTRRMQRALNYVGTDVITIFKGLQLDIGAPPQFMDFRYEIEDRWNGGFHLDHCGALMDVEPMGPDYVKSMCHDIEDPTFDATAVATNAKAQMRPIHRPPRSSTDTHPHCAWTVKIDESYPAVEPLAPYYVIEKTRAATVELAPIDPADDGMADYSGPLLDDLDFAAFSQLGAGPHGRRGVPPDAPAQPLVRARRPAAHRCRLRPRDLREAAGRRRRHRGRAAPERSRAVLRRSRSAARPRAASPAQPRGVRRRRRRHRVALSVRSSAAHEDGTWISLCGPGSTRPLDAIVQAVDPHLEVVVDGSETDWSLHVVETDTAAKEADEVAVTRFSGGATFAFQPRRSLPITPV